MRRFFIYFYFPFFIFHFFPVDPPTTNNNDLLYYTHKPKYHNIKGYIKYESFASRWGCSSTMSKCLYLFQFSLVIIASITARKLVVITGATGRLGQALCKQFIAGKSENDGGTVVLAGCRDTQVGKATFSSYPEIACFHCNFHGTGSVSALPSNFVEDLSGFSSLTIVNNAAICLEGTFLFFIFVLLIMTPTSPIGASRETMSRSLLVNSVKPVEFASSLIEICQQHKSLKCTVINVSSGDGELVYLNSDLSARLLNVDNLKVNILPVGRTETRNSS